MILKIKQNVIQDSGHFTADRYDIYYMYINDVYLPKCKYSVQLAAFPGAFSTKYGRTTDMQKLKVEREMEW